MPCLFGCPFIDHETDWDTFRRQYPQLLRFSHITNKTILKWTRFFLIKCLLNDLRTSCEFRNINDRIAGESITIISLDKFYMVIAC